MTQINKIEKNEETGKYQNPYATFISEVVEKLANENFIENHLLVENIITTAPIDCSIDVDKGTGQQENLKFKLITYPFDKYEIKVILSPDNRFIGIQEIKINKEFLSYRQKSNLGQSIADDLYRE